MKLRKELVRLLALGVGMASVPIASCGNDSAPLSFDVDPDASMGGFDDGGGGDGENRDAGQDGQADAGHDGGDGARTCTSAADCDDGIQCTIDDCVSGICIHRGGPPGATSCGRTSFCDPEKGCVESAVCSQDETCFALWVGDPCKANVRCDPQLAVCTYSILDKDGDGDAPVVCGGGDCDDADPSIHSGAKEICDGKDNDCNGIVDDGKLCPGVEICQAGSCACPSGNICGSECVDKSKDAEHCGGCFQSCGADLGAFCQNDTTLTVRDAPAVCSSGQCAYPNFREIYCAFGCKNGICNDDPCIGKSCQSPPARDCKDSTTARTYAAQGSCSFGVCSYAQAEIHCPYGCVNGFCRECSADAHCGNGKWCQSGSCVSCDTDQRCGSSCANCAASNKICSLGACVECVTDARCGAGSYCSGGACLPCNTSQKCGPTCAACSGSTPTCSGGACVCSGNSCGPNRQCVGNSCTLCKADSACGAACAPCGANRQCIDLGTSSQCSCLGNGDCDASDICDPDTHLCRSPCSGTGQKVFFDDFSGSGSATWAYGDDVQIADTSWKAFTSARHGLRIRSGLFEITNKRDATVPAHGHGYGYVKTGGTGSVYDDSLYNPVLKGNTDREIVWTFNMRKDVPAEWGAKNGGFKCTEVNFQNDLMVGLAYVLATNSAADLSASIATCSPTGTAFGYAVVLGGNKKLRLVRFSQGLRNGTITDIVASGDFVVTNFFSVRVTYNANTNQWKLEVRNDGASQFTAPKSGGAYHYSGVGTDSTYVNNKLEYAGPYFQTGCTGICTSTFTASFDNIGVDVRCAP